MSIEIKEINCESSNKTGGYAYIITLDNKKMINICTVFPIEEYLKITPELKKQLEDLRKRKSPSSGVARWWARRGVWGP